MAIRIYSSRILQHKWQNYPLKYLVQLHLKCTESVTFLCALFTVANAIWYNKTILGKFLRKKSQCIRVKMQQVKSYRNFY